MRKFHKRNNFYTNKSTQVPDLPNNTPTASHFPAKEGHGIKPTTTFSKIRNFDAKLDKIDINIKGSAPIFGDANTIKSYTLGSEVGNFTGSLNNVYFNEEFELLASVTRKARLSYWGVDTSLEFEIRPVENSSHPTPLDVIRYKAYDTWLRNVAGLVTMLKQSMYTDLNIFNWLFAKTRIRANNDATNKRFPVAYERIFQDPIAQLLINYQHDIQLVTMLVFRFEYLNALLPKLTTFYRKKADMFIYLQQQLRRSIYTAPVKSLMMWLKQRYIDKKYIQDYVLPLTILSKETDGLNSPIKYLSLINYTPMNCVKYGVDGVPYMPIFIGTQDLTFTREVTEKFDFDIWTGETQITEDQFNQGTTVNTGGSITDKFAYIQSAKNDLYFGSLKRELDAFDMSTLLTTIEESDNIDEFQGAIDEWLNTARNTLEVFQVQTLDMVRSQLIIDLETAIAKLASEPGGIQWEQNVEFSALTAVEKFDNWTLVGDLVTFNASKAKYYDNGYTLRIPMYADTGISTNEMKTYSQAWFLPSNDKFMSFLELEDEIFFTKRGDSTVYKAEVRYYKHDDYDMPYLFVAGDYADTYVIAQLPFGTTYFQDGNIHYNPKRMAYIIATFDNKWPEFVLEAIRSFIVPQG